MPKSLFRRFTKKFFIIINLIIAVLFLLGCYSNWFNPTSFWFLGLLTLGAFYLLLLLLGFILFWLFIKPSWCIISLATMLLAYKPITQIIPLRLSSSFVKTKQPNNIRVMSWNVEHFDILEYKTHPEKKPFSRGDEKGYFLFGGSTVIVLGEPGKWVPADDLLEQTACRRETLVRLGDCVARAV